MILVVAPDHGLRRSLVFVLEADGFDVTSHASLDDALAAPLDQAVVCAIVDEDATRTLPASLQSLQRLGRPVVLLAAAPAIASEIMGLTILPKPFLGVSLIKAVGHAIASGWPASGPT